MKNMAIVVLLALSQPVLAGLLSKPKDYTPDKSWPVVVSTQDNPKPEIMKDTPFFLIHAGGQGVECGNKIESELQALAAKCNIDPLRVYATSFSRGGQEILLQTADHPHWFAAIAPVDNDLRRKSGDSAPSPYMIQVKIIRTPVLQLHGSGDAFRTSGKELFELLKGAGVPITWADYPGGHDPRPIWDKTPKVWMSFFAKQVLDPYPKKIEHMASHKRYSRAYWTDVTLTKDGANLNGSFKLAIDKPNVITLQTGPDLAALDLYLCDKLVDMTKPVKVVEGDKTLFEGPAAEKITVKVRDGEAYTKKDKPALYDDLFAIGKKAGFAYKPIDLAKAVEALPETMPPIAPASAPASQPVKK